jgi:hypothetical protein
VKKIKKFFERGGKGVANGGNRGIVFDSRVIRGVSCGCHAVFQDAGDNRKKPSIVENEGRFFVETEAGAA